MLPNANLLPLFPDQIFPFDVCGSPTQTPPTTCMLVASLEGKQKGLSVLGLEGCHSNHVLDIFFLVSSVLL